MNDKSIPGGVRHLDDLGRVVVPKELRDALGWEPGQQFELVYDPRIGAVTIRPFSAVCVFCGEGTSIRYENVPLCERCAKEAAALFASARGKAA